MEKDPRYRAVKILIEAGYLQNIQDIFVHIPKSIVAVNLGTNNNRMSRLIAHPEQFTIEELNKIAFLIDTEPMRVVNLVYAQLSMQPKVKKGKK
jgi:hypothetical protein